MKPIKFLSTLLATVIVMNGVMLMPAVVPIIIPRATLRTISGCQSQTTGTASVIDAQGHTYTLTCGAKLTTLLGYPGLVPTDDAPWRVIITVWPNTIGLPTPCVFSVTRLPVHLQCAASSTGQATVDFNQILTVDYGGL